MRFGYALPAVAALATAASALSAQGSEFSAKLGLYGSQGDLRTGTTQVPIAPGSTVLKSNPVLQTKGPGWGVEFGWDLKPTPELGLGVGVHAEWQRYDAQKSAPWGADAKATVFGVDLIYQLPVAGLSIRTGPTMASWDITQKTPWNSATEKPATGSTGALGETTWKLGWRVGAEYRVNAHWSVTCLYGYSSWKTAINPSYLGAQVGYKFDRLFGE